MNPNDRRELSFLGALLLGWALVCAPLVHLLVEHGHPTALGSVRTLPLHAHGHSHGPGPSAPGKHGEGSLEHGQALFTSAPVLPSLVLLLVAVGGPQFHEPQTPSLPIWPRVEQSQGP